MHIQQIQARNPLKANLYVVDERRDGGAVGLVDACFGPGYERLARLLGDRRPQWVFLTHWHCDHVGWLGRILADYAPTVCCAAETAAYLSGEKSWRDSHFWREAGPWWVRPFWGLSFARWPLPVIAMENLTVVEPGAMLDFGGARWQVVSLPGHTLGHVGLYAPAFDALFSGDAAFRRGDGSLRKTAPFLAEEPTRANETFHYIRSMGLETIYPGHYSYGPVRMA